MSQSVRNNVRFKRRWRCTVCIKRAVCWRMAFSLQKMSLISVKYFIEKKISFNYISVLFFERMENWNQLHQVTDTSRDDMILKTMSSLWSSEFCEDYSGSSPRISRVYPAIQGQTCERTILQMRHRHSQMLWITRLQTTVNLFTFRSLTLIRFCHQPSFFF